MLNLSKAAKERIVAIISPIGALCIWQILSDFAVIDARYVPSPMRILLTARDLVASGELWTHVLATLYRLGVGFLLGAVPGIFVGMMMGLNRWVRAVIDPLVAAMYPIPKIAILPLLMLAFGIGDGSKIAVVAIAVMFLTLINTMVGVLTLDRVYFDVARNYGTPWHKLFRRVILPGALPTIFAGLRISLGVSLIVLVSAEFVASRAGIGYLIWSSWETLLVDRMFVGIIVITVLGVVTTALLREGERYLIPWRRE
jgi:ABC-type nitrate/sulfonate/bicarbonate transport system permease component